MFQLLTKGMGNQIPTVGPNNRQEPTVNSGIMFQDQRQQSANAQSNLGFNTVSQNATNVPRASTERAAPANAKNTTTSNVENTVKSIATDVQRLEGLENVEETLEKMDEKLGRVDLWLGRLVEAEESEEKARKAKKRQEELPKNLSGDEVKDTFRSGVGDRAKQVAGAGLGAVAGAGIMAFLFGPKVVEEMKEKSEEAYNRWNEVQKQIKKNIDDFLGTGSMIQDASAEAQIATKLALQSGVAGKTLTTGVDAVTSKPVATAAAKTAGLAVKGTTATVAGLAKVSAIGIDAATTAVNQAGQTTTKDSRGRDMTRNKKTGKLEAKVENKKTLRKGIDTIAAKANAVANAPVTKGTAKIAGGSAKIAAMVTKMIAQKGATLLAKALPLAGAAIGTGLSISKMIEGDYWGAAASGAGAILSFVPGPGTAAVVGIGAYELAREIYNNLNGQYPENDPNAGEKWPEVLEQTEKAVTKYIEDGLKQYEADKANIKKSEASGLIDKGLTGLGDADIDLKMAETATTGELESILRDPLTGVADEDKASIQAILKKRADAIDQGTPLSVAPGEAASLEADQAAESVIASNSWRLGGKIDAAKRKPATDDVEELAMAGATGQQPIVNVAPAKVTVPKADAPDVTVVVNVQDPMLNDDPYARNIGYA